MVRVRLLAAVMVWHQLAAAGQFPDPGAGVP